MRSLLLTVYLLLHSAFVVNAQDHKWVAKTVTSGNNYTRAVVVTDDYVYAGGRHRSPSYYVSGIDTIIIPNWYGSRDMYIAKYEKTNGKMLWVKHFGTSKSEQVWNMTADELGNIYVQGEFFDSLNIDGKIIKGLGKHDSFLAKFNPTGTCIWLKKFSSVNGAYINDVSVFKNHIYLAGSYTERALYFDADSLTGGGGFILKFDLSGNLIWKLTDEAKSAKGSLAFQGITFAEDTIFFTASAYYLSQLGTIQVQATNNQWGDFAVGAVSTNGSPIWIKHSGTSYTEFPQRIRKSNNRLFIAGTFTGKAKILDQPVFAFDTSRTVAQSFNKQNVFIIETDLNGNAKKINTVYADVSRLGGLELDKNGFVWISAMFKDSVTFNGMTYYATGGSDAFLGFIDEKGDMQMSSHFGGNNFNVVEPGLGDRAHDLDFDSESNDIFWAGAFSGPYNFSGLSGRGHFLNNHYGILLKTEQSVNLNFDLRFKTKLCKDSTYVFSAPQFSLYDTVSWKVIYGLDTTIVNGNNLNIMYQNIETGSIILEISNKSSQQKKAYSITWVECSTKDSSDTNSIEQQVLETDIIEVYPNPVKNLLNINSKNLSKTQMFYDILSLQGQMIKTGELHNDETIDFSGIEKGVYHINFHSNGSFFQTERIVKQ